MAAHKLEKVITLLRCPVCKDALQSAEESIVCQGCHTEFPIIDSVARFVPETFYNLDDQANSVQEKTKNYFGFEWDYFKDWGFVPDEDVQPQQKNLFLGGTIAARQAAFDSKCKISSDDIAENDVVLDAGCGNGRYTYEAASRMPDAIVIGVDIGYGSVKSAQWNTRDLENVIIIQADLFNLPIKDEAIKACFSNGVLMHTGNATSAFKEVSRVVQKGGVLTVNIYNRLNPFWEVNDRLLRMVTTRLSIESNLKLAGWLAKISAKIEQSSMQAWKRVNYFMRLQSTLHHMYDWYAAPVASHHTLHEIKQWYAACGFDILIESGENRAFWKRPWACNVKGMKAISDNSPDKQPSGTGNS